MLVLTKPPLWLQQSIIVRTDITPALLTPLAPTRDLAPSCALATPDSTAPATPALRSTIAPTDKAAVPQLVLIAFTLVQEISVAPVPPITPEQGLSAIV